MTNEQVAFAFIRELQKRFGKTAVLSDIEMSQEQGWTHAVVDVCDAYQAAHAAVEPKASQLHDRENRCVLCHKYRNEGAISCANCGLDFSLNRPAEPT
jgi:hypothetical protein